MSTEPPKCQTSENTILERAQNVRQELLVTAADRLIDFIEQGDGERGADPYKIRDALIKVDMMSGLLRGEEERFDRWLSFADVLRQHIIARRAARRERKELKREEYGYGQRDRHPA